MSRTVKLGNPRVRFHRNGSHAAGFHTVSFTEGRGKNKQYRRAVVFDQADFVAVVDPDNAASRFDGGYYEDALRAAIEAAANDPATYDREA